MNPLEEKEIRDSFVNCSKGEARRLGMPRGLADLPWPDLDFLGWRDPGAPDRGYIVAEHRGELVGLTLRTAKEVKRAFVKSTICSVCLTPHPGTGVALFTAPRVGAAGRQGNTIGTYICADLACPLYARGKRETGLGVRLRDGVESLTLEERADRAVRNLAAFLDRVLDPALT
ncbi:FBP domain-containing protein [Bailinhaonella thermotolerans]|uniref:FBP domain-containing protein n=1 Tax=Bailinhaonella thermotolerans TaxID=1070861 RepID=A0A3A4B016_9ACTN|nr:FBP domain-containing protein [Bailinhaonella thermotolerans]RJL34179.1 FBP domain-containing protein [Bailinhaonella thermotolerans]